MKAISLLTFLFAATFSLSQAQTFTNGSLEAGSTTPCQTVYNFQFPTFVSNTGFAFGTCFHGPYQGMVYFADGSCGEGAPQQGSNFLGIASNDAGEYDALSLKMTGTLNANKTYVLKFYIKKSPKTTPMPNKLDIGYSNDSLNFGTLVTTIEAPTSSVWKLVTVNIRPSVVTKYITIRGVKSSTGTFQYSYTFIDNFSLTPGVGVGGEEKLFAVAPHPNPFASSLSLSLDAGAKLPCQLSLTDITGRVVCMQTATNANVQMARGNIAPGVYMLQIEDASGAREFSRVVAE